MSPKTRGVKRKTPSPSKRKTKKNKIIFANDTTEDNVIKDIRNYYKPIPIDRQGSINNAILDHIALEGLEGITLKRLFQILDAIFSNFNILNDEKCQDYLWSILVENYLDQPIDAGIQAFYNGLATRQSDLEQARKNVLMDKPMKLPLQTSKRFNNEACRILYPVQDGAIMGSCSNYLTRQDITKELIDYFCEAGSRDSLCYANEKYDINNIFFVASQTIRSKTIYPSYADPNMKIILREYCTLELIGKSRTLGCVFPNNKTFGRYRIMLEKKKFITEYQETASHPIEHHLKKFSFVKKDPGFLQQQFRENSVRNQSKDIVDCQEDDEDNLQDDNKSDADNDEEEDDDDDDDDEEELNLTNKDSKLLLSKLCCNPPMMRPYRSILSTMYNKIANSEDGLTQLDLRRMLNLPKYQVRNHLKNLISLQMIWSGPITATNPFRRYKPAHKTRRRKKKRLIETGIMAKWDEKDLKAKKTLGQKRSTFTKAEDRLLILCRIASVLINPRTKLSWSVHKRVVRNVLHRELIESHDKTSDACLRRIKYLRKLPNSIKSIDELVASLRVDHDIIQLLSTKQVFKKDKQKTNRKLRKLFLNLLKIIKMKVPNLLGISSDSTITSFAIEQNNSNASSLTLAGFTSQPLAIEWPSVEIDINNYDEFKKKYDIVDCQMTSFNFPAQSCHQKYHSSSLIRLSRPISKNYTINIDENNEMPSFALLTSIYTYFSTLDDPMNLELNLKVPSNIVGIDQGNENFKSLCEKVNDNTKEIIARFLTRCGESKTTTLKEDLIVPTTSKPSDLNQSSSTTTTTTTTMTSVDKSNNSNIIDHTTMSAQCDTGAKIATRAKTRAATAAAAAAAVTAAASFSAPSSSSSSSQPSPLPPPTKPPTIEKQITKTTTPSLLSTTTTTTTTTTNDATTKMKMDLYSDYSNKTKIDDSRRALFLLRHELKTQALDKCGSLSDCLIVQPCNVRFHSNKVLTLGNCQTELFQNQAKLIESLLSWIIVFPGIEHNLLEKEFKNKNLSNEQLKKLLNIMVDLNLITTQQTRRQLVAARLFGCSLNNDIDSCSTSDNISYTITYEARVDAYIRYCQLMESS